MFLMNAARRPAPREPMTKPFLSRDFRLSDRSGIQRAGHGIGRTPGGYVDVLPVRTAKSIIGNTVIFAVITDISRNFVVKLVKLMQRTERPFALVSQQRRLLRSTSMP